MPDIKDRLLKARTAIGKTQEVVANEAEMNVTQYNAYERGRARPGRRVLERLAKALQVTPAELSGHPQGQDTISDDDPTISIAAMLDNIRERVGALLGLSHDRIGVRIELR